METKIASQIAGITDYRTVGQADHAITADEHALAVEVGHEIATRHGIDLDAYIAGQRESENKFARENGYACPHCGGEIHPASLLGSIKSEAKTAANRLNAAKPRPNAQGKPKPRKTKTD